MKTAAFSDYARYYDLLNQGKDYAAEAGFVDGLLRAPRAPAGSLLDIGCGTGAHAREFARLGWRVAGVDLSAAMIECARARTPQDAGIDYFVGAATQFDLGRQFSAIVSLFHVVSYQSGPDDAFRMFERVRRHLAPGGRFVFDFWHGPGVLADPPGVRVRRAEDTGMRVWRIAEPVHRPEACRVDVAYEVLIEHRATGKVDRVEEMHHLRYFFLPELAFMLERAGFALERTHAGLTPAALDGRAWYGLVVARAVE